jgi:hypothetical protein
MKKIILLLLIPLFFSCEKETIGNLELHDEIRYGGLSGEETSPFPFSLGTYKVEFISATGQNLVTGQPIDTMIVSGTFSLVNPIGPLDVLNIGERIKFTETQLYSGYYLSNLGDEWGYVYDCRLEQDLVTEEYDRLILDNYEGHIRVYNIINSSEDYIILSFTTQWTDGSPETIFTKVNIHLERTGP